jgi:putative two-component system response regulator
MRVLIIDDSRSSLAMIAAIVKDAVTGQIDTCQHPVEAIKRTQTQQYDLVLVDHIMPEMDGVEVTTA